MPIYRADDLRRDAERNVSEGRRLQDEHQADATGCCRTCGRVAPCDEQSRGEQLEDYYTQYAAESVNARPALEATG